MVDENRDEWIPFLNVQQVAELEKRLEDDPEDLEARELLMRYYMVEALRSDDYVAPHLKHLIWLIESHPDSALLSTSVCRLNFAEYNLNYRIVVDLWIQQVTKYPENPAVLGNAAYNLLTGFPSRSDAVIARKWLLTAEKLEPYNPAWKNLLGDYHRHLSMGKKDQKAKESSLKLAMRYYREEYDLTTDDTDKAFLLENMVECAFEAGDFIATDQYARALLEAAFLFEQERWKWNYGNAIHNGHIYLGKIALIHGDKDGALRHLQDAAKTPGSPQLNSYGPDKTLASSLLEVGENDAVLEYFRACANFWKMEMGRLTYWIDAIKNGQVIDFKSTDWFTSKEV